MKVSIIVPVYNSQRYIRDTIQSVIKQDYSNWELLIINDGSTDESENIIKTYHDERIRYFYQENQGVSAARNVGLKFMQGDYFCFLDADDIMPKISLEHRLEIFKKDRSIAFVDGKVDYYDDGLTKKIRTWSPALKGINPLKDLLNLSGKSFLGNTWMIRKKQGVKYQMKRGLTHGEDLLFCINLARKGGIYSYTNETVLHYRTGHQSAMKDLKGLENGYKEIYEEIKEMEDIPIELKKTFLKRAKNILCKSYLGAMQPLNAIKVLIKK